MTTSRAETEKFTTIERLTLTAHLLAALSTALIAVSSALRLSREGRLHESALKTPDHASSTQINGKSSPKDYFNI